VNHWPFIAAAYVLSVGGTLALLSWSLAAMRRAEGDAERPGRDR
jgi:hypothetical protein